MRGIDVPPFHQFCRIITLPVIDDDFLYGERVARNQDGNNIKVPSDTKYDEWRKMYDNLDVSNSLDKATFMHRNLQVDNAQFNEYKRYLKKKNCRIY